MLRANATQLVDVFLWECHYTPGSKCYMLAARLVDAGVPVVYNEPFPFEALGPRGGRQNGGRAFRFGDVWMRDTVGGITIRNRTGDAVAEGQVQPERIEKWRTQWRAEESGQKTPATAQTTQ